MNREAPKSPSVIHENLHASVSMLNVKKKHFKLHIFSCILWSSLPFSHVDWPFRVDVSVKVFYVSEQAKNKTTCVRIQTSALFSLNRRKRSGLSVCFRWHYPSQGSPSLIIHKADKTGKLSKQNTEEIKRNHQSVIRFSGHTYIRANMHPNTHT